MKTRNGIELNLKESKYLYTLNNYKFYFSSEFYLNKFTSELQLYNNIESVKLKNKYKNNIEAFLFLSISLYKKIEKRGFYIKDIKTNTEINEEANFKIVLDE